MCFLPLAVTCEYCVKDNKLKNVIVKGAFLLFWFLLVFAICIVRKRKKNFSTSQFHTLSDYRLKYQNSSDIFAGFFSWS